MDYRLKYLKYKNKYINLKNIIGGKIDNYDDRNIVNLLKQEFLAYIHDNMSNNELLPKPMDVNKGITIGTYNIHYFTDVYENENTYEKVIKDIADMKLDILLLEEAIIGSKIKIKTLSNGTDLIVDTSSFYDRMDGLGYKKIIVCSNVPSWFNGIYCNVLLIHQRILDLGLKGDDPCKKNYNSCEHLNEYIYSFEKAQQTCLVSGCHQGTKETRCYIYINFKFNNMNIHLYGTHLDVASENERANQIEQIINSAKQFNSSNDYVIILGDFNTNDLTKTYSDRNKNNYAISNVFTRFNNLVINKLKENNYIDLFQRYNGNVEMTAWNNFIVDFIFVKNGENKDIPSNMKSYIYYTNASDHLPLILHISIV